MSIEQQLDLCLRITVAALLSGFVGYNRERADHPAGLRTHILVGIGASLFTAIGMTAFTANDSRVAAQIVTGIGFLGAGSIVRGKVGGVHGVTTAAGIWSTAAIGMASGAALYVVAVFATLLTLVVLAALSRLDKMLLHKNSDIKHQVDHSADAEKLGERCTDAT